MSSSGRAGIAVALLVCACLEQDPSYGAGTTGTSSDGSDGGGSGSDVTGGSSVDGGDDAATSAEGSTGGASDGSTGGDSAGTASDATSGGTAGSDETAGSTTGGGPGHVAFATSTGIAPNFGGLSQADAICNSYAMAGGVPGTFVAMLSDSTTDVRDRITLTGPLRNMAGEVVAADGPSLWDGDISASIEYDEFGDPLPPVANAWTGSRPNGTADETCRDWTSNQNGDFATVGDISQSDGRWIANSTDRCSRDNRLYCVRQ